MISRPLSVLVLLIGLALAIPVAAQEVTSLTPDSMQSQDIGSPDAQIGTASSGKNEDTQSTGMVLGIPGFVNLEELSGTQIFFGGAASQGYGWLRTRSQGDPSGALSVMQPYAGISNGGYRHAILLEYSPTVDLVNGRRWDGSVLQRASLRAFDRLSRRWAWDFSGYLTDGQEYLRELNGFSTGQYPGWLTFSTPTDRRLAASGSTGLFWRRKPVQEVSFTFSDTYGYSLGGPHHDAGSARAQITNYFGRNSTWYAYAQGHRYSNQPGCTRFGTGGGFKWNVSASTSVSLEAGPEFGSGPCASHLSGNFGGSLAQHLAPRTILYIRASRDLVEPYLLQSKFTDIFSVKVWQKTSQNTDIAAGSGYARSSSFPGGRVSPYHGLLLFSEFHWRLSDSLGLVGSYRYFTRSLAAPNLVESGFPGPVFKDRHSWLFCSIVWHPFSRGMHRS